MPSIRHRHRHRRAAQRALLAALLAAVTLPAAAAAATGPAATAPPIFKIYLERQGVYRLGFDDLAAAGLAGPPAADPPASHGLGLEVAGHPVPVWVEDGGDGLFGPGDWLEFVGEELRGDSSHWSEHARFNVYSLRFDHPRPRRMTPAHRAASAPTAAGAPEIRRRQHLEEDLLILRLPPARSGESEELWYWARLAHNHRQPFAATLDLDDLDPAAAGTVDLSIHFRGWSKPRSKPDPELADHRVTVWLNGERLAAGEWNGTSSYLLEVPALPAGRLVEGDNTLEFKVPRRAGGDGQNLVDVVMLNWIEVSYPRHAWVADQARLTRVAGPGDTAAPLVLTTDAGQDLVLYGDLGSRTVSPAADRRRAGERRTARFVPAPGERAFFASRPAALLSPEAVVRDRRSRLADGGNRADYIIVAHRTLLEAIRPLAELHRARGLEVAVVDVEDVYDEFHHGVVHPQALKAFFERAYHGWQRPAPRWVLLVGDASWDGRNRQAVDANYADWTYRPGETRRFGKNKSTAYPQDAELNHRGLIPTWNYGTYEGHSASDNYFVAVDGDDDLPEMAIGRLPVVSPEEVARIVDKTVRYVTAPEVGLWRRNALFITNESRGFQRQSDRLAVDLSAAGFSPRKVYPASSEASNEHHTRRLIETFDEGQLFVHFLGHGGRYIWRTGPPDLKKNHDLFTLDHLDQLASTGRLPVVLSMTCYSAPFDHPSADSIGEKLLRIGERGAIAVLAASWRNTPSAHWGKVLLEELTKPGATVGEAVMGAKHRIKNRMFVETYNLLGDPAVPVALPAGGIELRAADEVAAGGRWSVHGVIGVEDFAGRVVVDLVDAAGEAVTSEALATAAPEFAVELAITADELAAARAVRAYAWDAERGVDAVGALELVR